jgi:uncharacterized surface protein with fasciclin (FAS1) repeats
VDDYATLYTFLEDNEDYSLFKSIVDAAAIGSTSQTMESVYGSYNSSNPGVGYTLFLPDNDAIESYLSDKDLTIDELTSSAEDCWNLATNHLITAEYYSYDFPNGEIPDSSLNGEYHTVIYGDTDDGADYYVDEVASVLISDNAVSNGVIHVIDNVLVPVTYTSCEWLEENSEYSIFYQALQLTGLDTMLEELDPDSSPVTMFVESDAVFNEAGIYSLDDLKTAMSPDQIDYTDEENPLYVFLAYHILKDQALYVSDMSDGTENHNTYAYYPMAITLNTDYSQEEEGLSVGIAINIGFMVYDTIVSESNDTTFIDYVSLYESNSNTPTLSGVLHFVNNLLMVNTTIAAATYTTNFHEDDVILEYYTAESSSSFEDDELDRFDFGGELEYIYYIYDSDEKAVNNDVVIFSGLYEISYTTDEILQSDYTFKLRIHANYSYGLVNIYLDGEKVGSTVNMGAIDPYSNANSYNYFSVGDVQITGNDEHVVTIKAITPGYVWWDCIQFVPITD